MSFLIQGAMAARGILANPAMFAGHEFTPEQCIVDWVGETLIEFFLSRRYLIIF